MSQRITLTMALCLSELDTKALSTGRSIAALSRTFVNSVQRFALCSVEESSIIEAWAELDSCRMYTNDSQIAESLSWQTIWSKQFLQTILEEKKRIFLNILRVYRLDKPMKIPSAKTIDKVGSFIKLPESVVINMPQSVLSDAIFSQRSRQLINLNRPEHPELEELQHLLSKLGQNDSRAIDLEADLRSILGWGTLPKTKKNLPDWVSQISSLGYRSDEIKGDTKSHYQAGTDFEVIVRHSLESIGFTVDKSHKGGAGGIDVACSKPYRVIGECKCGKRIPGNTVYELDNLGDDHFDDDSTNTVKIIIGPGQPTKQLKSRAERKNISIISPMSLQKLVEFNFRHPGSIDLIKLRDDFLKPGQIDYKIEEYIEYLNQRIRIYSHLVVSVREINEAGQKSAEAAEIRGRYNGKFAVNPDDWLEANKAHEFLIELSSPLAGYLGRTKGETWARDRFYFLRDLIV